MEQPGGAALSRQPWRLLPREEAEMLRLESRGAAVAWLPSGLHLGGKGKPELWGCWLRSSARGDSTGDGSSSLSASCPEQRPVALGTLRV